LYVIERNEIRGYHSLTGLGSRRQVRERCETEPETGYDLGAEIDLGRPSKTKRRRTVESGTTANRSPTQPVVSYDSQSPFYTEEV
jgi:hypothetical protein